MLERAGDRRRLTNARHRVRVSTCAGAARDPNDVLYRLAESAAAVVTDDYPTFIAREHNARSVPEKLDVLIRGGFQLCRADEHVSESGNMRPIRSVRRSTSVLPSICTPVAIRARASAGVASRSAVSHGGEAASSIPDLVPPARSTIRVKPSTGFRGGRRWRSGGCRNFLEETATLCARA